MTQEALVVIPARMAASRLPGKPLADIAGLPMIVHVWRRAMAAAVGPVIVAAAELEIAEAVRAVGGTALLTNPDHPSGSDRVWEAAESFDPLGRYPIIVNVQGDLPTLPPTDIIRAVRLARHGDCDIATLVAEIARAEEREDPNVVKAILELAPGSDEGRALYFTRATAPSGPGALWHHIGLYAYRREALARFVSLPPAELEKRERLEQLRALASGMTIRAAIVSGVPLGVDTPADLDRARSLIAAT